MFNLWSLNQIIDSGLQDINDVFAESNTYQPKVPSHDEEIVVRKKFGHIFDDVIFPNLTALFL